jgi:hypothetical protein
VSKIVAVSMEQICAEAVKAATDVLKGHGIERPAVVINFAWKDGPDDQTYAIGTAIPRRYRAMMRDSLAQSAEEAS